MRRVTCDMRLDHDSPAEYLRNFVAILYIRSRIIPDLCVPVYSERDAAKESSATQLPQKSAPKQYKGEFNAGDLFMKARRLAGPPGCEGSSSMLRKWRVTISELYYAYRRLGVSACIVNETLQQRQQQQQQQKQQNVPSFLQRVERVRHAVAVPHGPQLLKRLQRSDV